MNGSTKIKPTEMLLCTEACLGRECTNHLLAHRNFIFAINQWCAAPENPTSYAHELSLVYDGHCSMGYVSLSNERLANQCCMIGCDRRMMPVREGFPFFSSARSSGFAYCIWSHSSSAERNLEKSSREFGSTEPSQRCEEMYHRFHVMYLMTARNRKTAQKWQCCTKQTYRQKVNTVRSKNTAQNRAIPRTKVHCKQ